VVPDRARLREDTGDQPVDRDRRSGGIFAPSLFIGVTSGMAYGDIVRHIFGAGAGQPALYAVVAMGAVFTSAARAPLTSLASVLEMRGDFALTLPVMLAVAIASTVSRALSNGTIYTTKRYAAA
jgi:CIC family chloride channel protein